MWTLVIPQLTRTVYSKLTVSQLGMILWIKFPILFSTERSIQMLKQHLRYPITGYQNHSTRRRFSSQLVMFVLLGLENQITFNPTVNIRSPEVFPFGYSCRSELTNSIVSQPIKARPKAQLSRYKKLKNLSHTRKC